MSSAAQSSVVQFVSSFPDLPVRQSTLVLGDSGDAVVELQKLLLHWTAFSGYTVPEGDRLDGQFNNTVKRAVETFQRAMFLQPDGVVGASTWQALYTGTPIAMPVLRAGSTGIEVSRLQRILVITGDLAAPDLAASTLADHNLEAGTFGHVTEAAVRRFQQRSGLAVDGIVGLITWNALSRALCPVV